MNEIREILSKASPGPWRTYMDGAEGVVEMGNGHTLRVRSGDGPLNPNDLAIIELAHQGALVVAEFNDEQGDPERTDEGDAPVQV